MKKIAAKLLALWTALALLCTGALALEIQSPAVEEGFTSTVSIQNPSADRFTIVIQDADTAGRQFLLLALSDDITSGGVPTENNIIYINQSPSDDTGASSFSVYPSALAEGTYYVFLSSNAESGGFTAVNKIATFDVASGGSGGGDVNSGGDVTSGGDTGDVMLGDVIGGEGDSGDGRILANDAQYALQISSRLVTPTARQLAAADLNGDGTVRANEAQRILQCASRLITQAELDMRSH